MEVMVPTGIVQSTFADRPAVVFCPCGSKPSLVTVGPNCSVGKRLGWKLAITAPTRDCEVSRLKPALNPSRNELLGVHSSCPRADPMFSPLFLSCRVTLVT